MWLNVLVSDYLELMHFAAKAPLQSNNVNEEASSVESVSDKWVLTISYWKNKGHGKETIRLAMKDVIEFTCFRLKLNIKKE